jgi:hypothetical protein
MEGLSVEHWQMGVVETSFGSFVFIFIYSQRNCAQGK